MQFHELDKDPQTGAKPISMALMVLYTLLNSNKVSWAPGQKDAARAALEAARVSMSTDVTVKQKADGGFVLEFVQLIATPSGFNAALAATTPGMHH